jgi:hypothetical protein
LAIYSTSFAYSSYFSLSVGDTLIQTVTGVELQANLSSTATFNQVFFNTTESAGSITGEYTSLVADAVCTNPFINASTISFFNITNSCATSVKVPKHTAPTNFHLPSLSLQQFIHPAVRQISKNW